MLKVLVVEDEEMIRKGIVLAVDWAALDCVVVGEAANGEEALEAVERLKPSLIITDLKMPKMDGHRMLKLVREDERLGSVPLVLFSSLISEEMKRKGEELGASGQISKPEINQLIGLLDNLVFGEPLRESDKEMAELQKLK